MKIISKIWWIPFILYFIGITSFVNRKVSGLICRDIKINIKDSASYSFVTPDDIFSIVQNDNRKILGNILEGGEIKRIEEQIGSIRELSSAEVFLTIDGTLHVEADQRNPAMRIISSYGNSYFIDNYGFIIPHQYKYTPRVIAISGNIEVPDESILAGDISSLPENSMMTRIFSLVSSINGDQFWSGQIEQIWVTQNDELELIPRVGQHLVRFGSTERFEEKLAILKTFYKEVLPDAGWNKYSEINLKYTGQVVCRKR